MTPLILLAVSLAGGLGAALRFLVDDAVKRRITVFPLGTAIINLSGSLALGVLTGLGVAVIGGDWMLILGTGFLGGYTTFSTASVEAVRLASDGRFGSATLHAFGMLVGCAALAGLGVVIGGLLA